MLKENTNEKNLQEGKSLVFETLGSIMEMQKTTDSKTGLMKLTGTFGVCGVINNNNRIYEKNNYAAMVKELQKEITEKGGIPGELEHPQTMNISLENVSHKITDINIDENGLVTGTIELLNTPKGKIAQSIVEGGLPLFVSSRATGEIHESRVTLSKIYTYDLVGTPGFSQARVHLNENQNVTELNESIYVITEKENKDNKNKSMEKKTYKQMIQESMDTRDIINLVKKIKNPDFGNIRYGLLSGDDSEAIIEGFDAATEDSETQWPLVGFALGRNKKPKDSLAILLDGDYEGFNSDDLKFDYSQWITTNSSLDKVTNIYFVDLNPKSKNAINIRLIGWSEDHIRTDNNCTFSYDDGIDFYDYAGENGTDDWEDDEYNENKKPRKDMYTKQEISNLIQEAIEKSEKNQENYILDVLAPTLENWLANDYAKVVEAWLEEEYSKKVQQITENYVINNTAPVIEKWIVEEYSKELENWLLEHVVGILDKYINEQLTPGILDQAKKEIHDSLKDNKESKLGNIKEMLTMLEGLSSNNSQNNKGSQFKPATNVVNESGSNVSSFTEPVYIQQMPDHIRPKYINLNESVKEIIATKAKLFNFNIPGAVERFWSDFDTIVEKYSNDNGKLNENYQGKYNSGLTLNNYENSIRENLRQRFSKYKQ